MSKSSVRRIGFLTVAAMVSFCAASPLFAWNDAGHMLVARIAWLRLSPQERANAGEILAKHPHYKTFLTDKCPDDVSPIEWAFLRAATWSDYIRPPKTLEPEKVAVHDRYKFHRSPWHYINFAYRAGQSENSLPREPIPHDTNILIQIDRSRDVLRGKMTHDPDCVPNLSTDANRAVRLCWLFHMIGDLHQPLHAVALVDEKLFPNGDHGDQGGNLLAIRPDAHSKPQRLHAYWDGILGYDSRFGSVCDLADLLSRDPMLAPAKLEELAHGKHPHDWAAESYLAAKTYAYRDGALPRVLWADVESEDVTAEKVPAVSTFEGAQSRMVARRRLTLAGIRLAETLKSIVHEPNR